MRTYKLQGTKVYMYVYNRLFDVYLFHTPKEAEAFIEKETFNQLRWEMPY